ncbi:MAG TPA: cation transporter [Actinobacteria bacterium]|nr:cation transporter [Actinomycetota bacterium]
MSAPQGRLAVVTALGANLAIAAAKFVVAAVTGSASMLAEAVHSVADSGNQILLLVGAGRARRPATPTHPFGFGRLRYVYGFVVAIVLFVLGGLFALLEGWHKITDPEPLGSINWALGVLAFAIVAEAVSLRTAVVESRRAGAGAPLWEFVRTSRTPELPVVLLEDIGALVGLFLATTGVLTARWTGDARFDGAGSMAVGVLLIVIATILAREMSSLLLGESALPEQVHAIEGALAAHPGIDRVMHLRTVHLGPDELLVAAKVAVHHSGSAADVASAIDGAERAVREAVPIDCVIYLEPDLDRGSN